MTNGIRVRAAATLLPNESDPEAGEHVYAYRVRIMNEGTAPVRLLSRHWVILDAHNHREDVVGEGVVGKQPDLAPGEMYEYVSRCPLRTEWGTMEGTYAFQNPDGTLFDVQIGRFFLVPSKTGASAAD